MKLQDILDYISTALIVLGGIGPLAISSNLDLPSWSVFVLGLAIMALSALQKQYQRKLEREAQQQPSPEQRLREGEYERELRQAKEELAALEAENEILLSHIDPPTDTTQPAGTYGTAQ